MKLPEIYADFNKLDDQNRIRLTTLGSIEDIARQALQLRDGLPLIVTMDDADDDGNSDDLMADAIVRYNEKEKCWVAQIEWSSVKNRSEREKALGRKGLHGRKNGEAPASKKPKKAKSRKPLSGRKSRKIAKKA